MLSRPTLDNLSRMAREKQGCRHAEVADRQGHPINARAVAAVGNVIMSCALPLAARNFPAKVKQFVARSGALEYGAQGALAGCGAVQGLIPRRPAA